ncbi:MAG: nicotinate-nucleotide--dimethylbenzimidazole phosphoribosyltransferase [Lachnospiraceae bacterium]|nr:nicotinate-nucleotide--dimethylbenzimidazole phosphoribosyltransferase [Lachnospiraceae bacterium]
MSRLDEVLSGITERDKKAYLASKAKWDSIAKPLGSLGAFEEMVSEIAALRGSASVCVNKPVLLVFCADNGVVNEGVSQTGSAVTLSVMKALGKRESTVSFMAKGTGCEVLPVDVGVLDENEAGGDGVSLSERETGTLSEVLGPSENEEAGRLRILNRRIINGTGDIFKMPAMTGDDCERAVMAGIDLVQELKELGYDCILTGEMGIGNTTTSAAVASALTGEAPERFVGRGAGIPSDKLSKKLSVVKEALRVNRPDGKDPIDVISKVGGLDIAALCGVFLGGARYGIPVIIDGYISSVAALCAYRLSPLSGKAMFASHISAESGGDYLTGLLKKDAVISAGMYLGEGSGALMLLSLLQRVLNVYESGHDFGRLGIEPYKRFPDA